MRPGAFVFCERVSGAMRFKVEAAPGGSSPVEKAAQLTGYALPGASINAIQLHGAGGPARDPVGFGGPAGSGIAGPGTRNWNRGSASVPGSGKYWNAC